MIGFMGQKPSSPDKLGPVFSDAGLTVRPVRPDDWADYRDFYKSLSNPHHFNGFLQGQDLDAQSTYQNLFDQTIGTGSLVMFGLWHGKKMIGQSSIQLLDTDHGKHALLAGSEIADSYRGRQLVDHLYQGRMQYLQDINFEGSVSTEISPKNSSSQKAAIRNGFINTGETVGRQGYQVYRPSEAN